MSEGEKIPMFRVPNELRRVPEGAYGTNEGDIWASDGSEMQEILESENPGHKLIHEVIDGEEKMYVVDTHAGLWQKEQYARARAGSEKYLRDQDLGFGIGGAS